VAPAAGKAVIEGRGLKRQGWVPTCNIKQIASGDSVGTGATG